MLLVVRLGRIGDERGREAADGLILILDGREELIETLERGILKSTEGHMDTERVARLALADLPGPDGTLIDVEDFGEVGATEAKGFAPASQTDWREWIAGHGVSYRRGGPGARAPGPR